MKRIAILSVLVLSSMTVLAQDTTYEVLSINPGRIDLPPTYEILRQDPGKVPMKITATCERSYGYIGTAAMWHCVLPIGEIIDQNSIVLYKGDSGEISKLEPLHQGDLPEWAVDQSRGILTFFESFPKAPNGGAFNILHIEKQEPLR